MNIMITSLSLIQRNYDGELEYTWNSDGPIKEILKDKGFKGIQTNEAATKFFLWYLNNKGENLDQILYMASDEVMTINKNIKYDKVNKKVFLENDESSKTTKTTEVFYKERIEEFCDEENKEKENFEKKYNYKGIEFIPIRTSGASIPQELIEKINELQNQEDEIHIYFDTTGGQRDDINRLQLLAKFLTYKGIKIDMPVYCNLGKKTIERVDIYDMLDVLDGVSQFTATGQSTLLKKSIQGENDEIDQLLKTMQRFADDIQLCRVENLDTILSTMSKELENLDNSLKNIGKESEKLNDISASKNKLIIFKQLIPIIKEKFFGSNNSIGYPGVVQWCVENGFIQQALTIYTELMPRYILKNIIEYKGNNLHNDGNRALFGTKEAEDLYTGVLGLRTTTAPIRDELDDCKDEYEKIKGESIQTIIKKLKSSPNEKMRDFIKKLEPYIDKNNPEKFILSKFKATFKECRFMNGLTSVKTKGIINHFLNVSGTTNLRSFLYGDEAEEDDSAKDISGKTISKKISAIKSIENFICEKGEEFGAEKNKVIRLRGDVTVEELKDILYDYVYVKAMRNKLNHASEKENITGDNAELYKVMGYGDMADVSIDNLKNNIYRAIDRLTAKEDA